MKRNHHQLKSWALDVLAENHALGKSLMEFAEAWEKEYDELMNLKEERNLEEHVREMRKIEEDFNKRLKAMGEKK